MASPTLQYTNVETLMLYLDLHPDSVGDSGQLLASYLASAESFIQTYTGRQFYPTPALVNGVDNAAAVSKTFEAHGLKRVRIPDLRSFTSVTLDGTTIVEPDDFRLDRDPLGVEPSIMLWLEEEPPLDGGDIVITGRWGFLSAPYDLLDAAYHLAARRYRERDASYADQVSTPEGGILAYFRTMPKHVEATLKQYRAPRWEFV